MYLLLKTVHVACAILTISGFILRGYWMVVSPHLLQRRITRIAPHVVDTLFLLSGIAMLWMISLNPLTQPWLLAKFAGLIGYILLGMIAIRRGRTLAARKLAFAAAIVMYAYIAGVALSRPPVSWAAYL